jgi:hypothetical protein
MSKRQRRDGELMRDYELMRVRRVRPNPPAPTLPVNVPDPQIHMHVENIFEVNDISTQHHVIRVNGTEVVDLLAEDGGPAIQNSDAYPDRTVTVLIPAVEVVIQYPPRSTRAQGRIQCLNVQYTVDESSESESEDNLID